MSKPVSRGKRSAARTKRDGARRSSHSNKSSDASNSDRPAKSARPASSRTRSASNTTASASKAASAPIDLDAILPEAKLYYRIGEVSQITGVKAYVLRYWESEFRWMAPQKSRSKQRLYRRKDIETILLIRRLLYEERYTIAGARQRLRELGAARAGKGDRTDRTGKADNAGRSAGAHSATATPEPVGDAASSLQIAAAKAQELEADYRARFAQIKQELVAIRTSL